jgi:hypothetical protein
MSRLLTLTTQLHPAITTEKDDGMDLGVPVQTLVDSLVRHDRAVKLYDHRRLALVLTGAGKPVKIDNLRFSTPIQCILTLNFANQAFPGLRRELKAPDW